MMIPTYDRAKRLNKIDTSRAIRGDHDFVDLAGGPIDAPEYMPAGYTARNTYNGAATAMPCTRE